MMFPTNTVVENTFNKNEIATNYSLTMEMDDPEPMGCIDCHSSSDLHNMHWDPESNFNGNLVVHQPQNSQFIEGLELFMATHSDEEAFAKFVDKQKVADFIDGI